jgi:hypothetical protein
MVTPLAYRTSRVTISGTYAGGAEEWSTGFWFGNAGGDATLPDQALADGIRDAWRTFFITLNNGVSNLYESTLVKVSSFGTDGKSNPNDTVYANFPVQTKGVANPLFPPQIALVATLQSADPRGLAAKGRMYLPGVNIALGTDGRIPAAGQGNIVTGIKTFLAAVNALPADNVILNASHGQLTKDIDGSVGPKVGGYGPVSKPVISVKVGNVYDTQRRRRNGMSEVYVAQNL